MGLALFGFQNWDIATDDLESDIKKLGYVWVQWDYKMAADKVREFKGKKFKIYAYHSAYPDSMGVYSCSNLEYDEDGMDCPEPDKAFHDYKEHKEEYEEEGRIWRTWVKVEKFSECSHPPEVLKKLDGTPPKPQGAQNSFIYVWESNLC